MNFATLHFDTHKVVKLLEEKGYSEEQAIGFMTAMQEITLSGVATKEDIQSLKSEIFKFIMIQFIALVGVMVGLSVLVVTVS